jgi:hypothetical protein
MAPAPRTSEYCLFRATDCERLAEQAVTTENKAILLELAERWRKLAAESLKIGLVDDS